MRKRDQGLVDEIALHFFISKLYLQANCDLYMTKCKLVLSSSNTQSSQLSARHNRRKLSAMNLAIFISPQLSQRFLNGTLSLVGIRVTAVR